MEKVIKTVTGDAAYITEQEFLSVDDAYNNRNPITEVKATVSYTKINNTKYKLKEVKYIPKGFKVGDVRTQKGRKSTITDIDPKTGGVTWSIEDIAAFDTVYKTFDKLRELLRTLETTGDAKEDTIIDTISDEAQDLFNKFRTHIRRTCCSMFGYYFFRI